MGQTLSLNTFTPDVIVYIQKYFPKYNIIKLLNNGMLYKTVLISVDKDDNPLILKIFFKNNYNERDKTIFLQEYNNMQVIQQKIFQKQINNVSPIIRLENEPLDVNSINRPVGMIFRQYTEFNLQERIYLMPYLQNIEKIWITFQLLYCLNDLKEMKIIHGDLKPENILLTSNLSLYISDFATYKPAYVSIEDIADYTYYFGTNSTDTMKGCYLAPERFVEKNIINENNEKTYQMDVFSAGVIIAELFLERNIFDYTGLLNYRKGNKNLFNIDEILSKIPQSNIRSLIYKMIAINPEERIDISEALKIFSNEICPIAIPGFIFHFNTVITSTKFWKPDLIIGHIYRYWGTIWKIIFGINENPIPLNQNLNFSIINKIILESPFTNFGDSSIFSRNKQNLLYIGNYELIMNPENGEIYEKFLKRCDNIENKSCIHIIIDYILEAIQYTKYDTTNLLALEMLYILSKKLSDVAKLQLTLPYFINNLQRKKYIIQVTSINYLFDILYSIDYLELVLPVTEYNYFGSYVFPALLKFYKKENPYIILEFFNNVDKIIDLEQKFLDVTLRTRLKKNKENLSHTKNKNFEEMNLIKEESEENNVSLNSSNNPGINDNYDDNVRPSIFSAYRESSIKPSKDKTYEIYNDYDSNLESFKNSLFTIILDLIGRNNETDILITFIRKLPSLLLFYGKSKTNDFSKFIINNFNKPDWIIQKEILKHIPQMTITLGDKPLNDYILPCMDMLITNNSDELKLLELIKSINQLLKMEYLSQINSIDYFQKLLPFLLHPNMAIKNEILNLWESLFNYLTQEQIFCYLYQPFEKFLILPPIKVDKNTIINYCKKSIPRFLYQLEILNINYNISDFLKDENIRNDPQIGINNLELLKEMIDNQKAGNLNTDYTGDINYLYDQYNESKNQIEDYKKYSLLEPLDKYIKKEIKSMQGFSDKGFALETKIFGKIFFLGGDKEKLKFPNFKNNTQISFENNNSIISSDLFRITYVLKTLGISMKMVMLEELLNYKGENENELLSKRSKSMGKIENVLANYYFNKSYNNWRPQGQLITTLYDHMTIPVEKLIPFDNSNFCSFDNLGNAILYNVKYNKDNELIINKRWQYISDNKEDIIYKNNICCIDNSYFALGIKKYLYQYNPHIPSKSKDVSLQICESNDDSNISCIKPFGYSSKENQKILFCTENGSINLYDGRTNHEISLNLKIPKEKGIMNCICESFEYGQFLISTFDGNLLKYDLRLNSIIDDFKYCYGTPISGINIYRPSKLSEFEFTNNQYILLWSAAEDHEISFFNYSDMNCDLLLKLNIENNSNEYSPLEIEIPFFENFNDIKNDLNENKIDQIKNKFKYLERYTYVYNKNKIKRFFSYEKDNNEYESINQKINNLNNIYNNPNTVQCVLSPFSDFTASQNNYIYENSPYIISAGNDKVIRYWDINKDLLNNNNYLMKSYIINAPNNLITCQFTKGSFDKTSILQSNENYNLKGIKANIPGFSEFQNFNGTLYHSSVQNEFNQEDNELKYCTKISDPSHKSVITDLLPMNINGINMLLSSSWDGTVKLWK